LNKHYLMLSAAVAALLAGPAFADTTVSTSTSGSGSALTTGTLETDAKGTGNAGNVTITSAGALKIDTESVSAITVNSNSYVHSSGIIQNNGVADAYGIRVDLSANPDLSSAGYAYTAADSTTRHAAIYLDSGSNISLTGSGKSTKYGIWLDTADTTDNAGTVKGDIVLSGTAAITTEGTSADGIYFTTGSVLDGNFSMADGSKISITGDSSYGFFEGYLSKITGGFTMASGSTIYVKGSGSDGIYFYNDSTLGGDLILNGTLEGEPSDATSTSSTSLYGLYMAGKVGGDLIVGSTGKVDIYGQGAQGMLVSGQGVAGSFTIEGEIIAQGEKGVDGATAATSTTTTYPEGSLALAVGGSVGHGIEITSSGVVKTVGTAEAFLISPSVAYGAAEYTDSDGNSTPASLAIGLYNDTADPGFGVYNRGTIAISPTNTNVSAGYAFEAAGGGSKFPTIIAGGIYNSGKITASAVNSTDKPTAVNASAMYVTGYIDIGGSGTSAATYVPDSYSCTPSGGGALPVCTYNSGGVTKNEGDKASLVNTGTISASISGTGGGKAAALYISANAHVSSIINTGTILGSALVDADYTDTVTSLSAYGIVDYSGSLTYIYNTGTIAAQVTTLDNNAQYNVAIYSSGNTGTASGNGFTVVSKALSATAAATIHGNVQFGDGNNQQIYLEGFGTVSTTQTDAYGCYYGYSCLSGNVSFGSSPGYGVGNGDLLSIGTHATVTGKVIATSGVEVNIANTGTLNLQNDTTSLTATNFTVHNGGTLNFGVSNRMANTGTIDALGTMKIESGATLGVTYSSFIPLSDNTFVLIRAPKGDMTINDSVISTFNSNYGTGSAALPFLFSGAELRRGTSTDNAYDQLLLTITTKSATGSGGLGLTGYASQIFDKANTALGNDSELGAAMVNSVGNCTGCTTDQKNAQAQAAYNSFAPNATGGTRAIAISLTDQATGVIGARQRALRQYGTEKGGTTLWGQAFVQTIKVPGQGEVGLDGSYAKNGFKDKGVGMAFGMDGGSLKTGWYGGAITVFNGNVSEIGRDSHETQLWAVASGYSTWRGKGFFFDSKIDAGYGRVRGKRILTLTGSYNGTDCTKNDSDTYTCTREADNSHPALLLSGGFSTGAIYSYGAFTFTPQISVDGLLLRQEGYTERNPNASTSNGDAFDLKIAPSYARSLRGFVGASARYDIDVWGVALQPEARAGYRYDVFRDPAKLKTAFAYADTTGAAAVAGEQFTVQGLDPAQGNFVLGTSLGADADGWLLNFGFDLVSGSNNSIEQVSTINLLSRF